MEHQEFLRTISEVAITLTGFIGIVAALKIEASEWSARTIMQFSTLLRASVAASLLSFVPYLVFQFVGDASIAWRLSAMVFCLVMGLNIGLFIKDTKGVKLSGMQAALLYFGMVVCVAVFLSVFNVLNPASMFLVGVVWQIMVGVNNFAQLLISDIRTADKIKEIQT